MKLRKVLLIMSCVALLSACAAPAGILSRESYTIETDSTSPAAGSLTLVTGGKETHVVSIEFSKLVSSVSWDSRTGGRIDALSIPLGDIDVSPETVPPDGLRLRDVVLELSSPVTGIGRVSPEGQVVLETTAPLKVGMSVVLTDGSLYRLGSSETEPASLQFVADADSIGLRAECLGVCWRVGGLLKMSDAVIDVVAPATFR